MDDDLILPETSAEDFVESTPPPKKSKTTAIVIVATAAFLCLVGALIFVLLHNGSEPNQPTQDQDTSEDTLSKYDAQAFNNAMPMAEERLEVKDYVGVEYYTKNYTLPEYMTLAQRYRYYSILTALYSEEHLNKPDLFMKYSAIADDTLKSIRKGEE